MLQASIQLDESTNSTLESYLIAFFRYEKDRKLKEEFLYSNTLSATTTAADVKALVDSIFEANDLSWQNFKHICTDGPPAAIVVISGFVTLVNDQWPHAASSLFTTPIRSGIKDSTPTFDGSYERCGQSDYLHSFEGKKAQALPAFGQKNGAQHVGLLLYTKISGLSRGKCLSRFYELKTEVEIVLLVNKNNLHVQFHNKECVDMLAYLANVFCYLNDINLSLQGRDVTVSDVKDKLAGQTARMGVWQAQIKKGSTILFPLLVKRLKMNKNNLPDNIKTCIIEHFEIVSAEFRLYFNDNTLHA